MQSWHHDDLWDCIGITRFPGVALYCSLGITRFPGVALYFSLGITRFPGVAFYSSRARQTRRKMEEAFYTMLAAATGGHPPERDWAQATSNVLINAGKLRSQFRLDEKS